MIDPIEEIKLEEIKRSRRKGIERWQQVQEHLDNLDQKEDPPLPEAQQRVQNAASRIFRS